eukprot:TRINITY_DN7422_c0_g1_i1.p1 TRINITY_DN7422_c0_g1~~TRINITY_DN7422_c0_g1_i1.p1  ORF type:complete len:734 (+),score=144.65 TRINITY_DN7422_c0_g1_i1:51-2252(+)
MADRYTIQRKLGNGTFGAAWLVHDTSQCGQEKVLKRVYLGTLSDDATKHAEKEAEILEKLNHPGILTCFEHFIDSDCLCIITEYCDDGDLSEKLQHFRDTKHVLPEAQVLDYFVQLTMAINYLHNRQVLHRDIKTQNIFLKSNGLLKLGDFGIARVLADGTQAKATTFAGTPFNMSPEALQGMGYNSKSDMWSLGCVLYEICTLEQPFNGAGLLTLLYQICENSPPTLPSNYSSDLRSLQSLLWTREPSKRPSAAHVMEMEVIKLHLQHLQANANTRATQLARDRDALLSVGHTKRPTSQRSATSRPNLSTDQIMTDSTWSSTVESTCDGSDVASAMQAWLDTSSASTTLGNSVSADSTSASHGKTIPLPQEDSRQNSPDNTRPSSRLSSVNPSDSSDDLSLTPRQRMLLRKQHQADQRAAELTQAAHAQHSANSARYRSDRDRLYQSTVDQLLNTSGDSMGSLPTLNIGDVMEPPSSTHNSPTRGSPLSSLRPTQSRSRIASPSHQRRTSPLAAWRRPPSAELELGDTCAAPRVLDRFANTVNYDADDSLDMTQTLQSWNFATHQQQPRHERVDSAPMMDALRPIQRMDSNNTIATSDEEDTSDVSHSEPEFARSFASTMDTDALSDVLAAFNRLLQEEEPDVRAKSPEIQEIVEAASQETALPSRISRLANLRKEARSELGADYDRIYTYLRHAREHKVPEAAVQAELRQMSTNDAGLFAADQIVYMELFS